MTFPAKAKLHVFNPVSQSNKVEEVTVLGPASVSMSESFPPFIGREAQVLLNGLALTVDGKRVWLELEAADRAERHTFDSATLWTVEGAEVTSGFCEPCGRVHSLVEKDGRRIKTEDLNPLVRAACAGVEAHLARRRER